MNRCPIEAIQPRCCQRGVVFQEYQEYLLVHTLVNWAGKEVWKRYNVNEDPTELNDLAKSNPSKLKELQALFDAEAKKKPGLSVDQLERLTTGIY